MTHPVPVRSDLLDDAAERARRYLDAVRSRRVAPSAEAVEALRELEGLFPDDESEPRAVLELLDRLGSPATVAANAGRFFGFVNGGALPASIAATWRAGARGQDSPPCA